MFRLCFVVVAVITLAKTAGADDAPPDDPQLRALEARVKKLEAAAPPVVAPVVQPLDVREPTFGEFDF